MRDPKWKPLFHNLLKQCRHSQFSRSPPLITDQKDFVLVGAPIGLGQRSLGLVYFVFLPSLVTTALAGGIALRCGARVSLWGSLTVAGLDLPLLLVPLLPAIIVGLALIGVGSFFAQATATGEVRPDARTIAQGRAVRSGRASPGTSRLTKYSGLRFPKPNSSRR